MSDHHHDHDIHEPPTNFFKKYVFSTDHKVIGIQFTFASLFFVIFGATLALGVRYQLAWPNQHVAYGAKWDVPVLSSLPGAAGDLFEDWTISPGQMTSRAPEANVALWKAFVGDSVDLDPEAPADIELSAEVEADGRTFPAGTRVQLTGFPEGIAIELPVDTRIAFAGQTQTLSEPLWGYVDASQVMADYNYSAQEALINGGTTVRLPAQGEDAAREVQLVGERTWSPAETQRINDDVVALPVLRDRTVVSIDVPAQTVGEADEAQQIEAASLASVPAGSVNVNKEALTSDAYLQMFTMHATIMVFFVLMPMLMGGFGNFLIPLMIGARDMAFPKLNMLSFWIAVPSGGLMMLSFWTMGGAAGGGWTMYPTLSNAEYSSNVGTTLWLASIALVGFSTIVGTLNYITTIINMRAPGLGMFRLPLTIWSLLITSILALFATPVLTAAGIMLLLDRTLGTMFFDPSQGGQPLLWQHLFWFFGHPEVYILILPAMGIASDVLSTFARKPIFGYKPMVFAMMAISGLGFIVWGHHMFQSGMNPMLGTTFMATTIMIALPSAIKTFNWMGTLWGGNIRFTPAMLYAIGFVAMFVIGGLSGIFMAAAPTDIQIHDTYFVVAHIHYVFFGGTLMGVFTGIYYWYPKMFGGQMNQKWGTIHFILTMIGLNGTFFMMHVIGVGGHPRRYASILEYPTLAHLQPLNVLMTLFALMLGMAQIPFIYNFFASLPYKLSRAMVALFAALLTAPIIMNKVAYGMFDEVTGRSTLVIADWFTQVDDAGARFGDMTQGIATLKLSIALLVAACIWAAIVTAVVFAIWAIGSKLRIRPVLNVLLYPVTFVAFVLPLLVKQDAFLWLGVPGLHDSRWVIAGLIAVAALVYAVVAGRRDRFGYEVDPNPWQANSLEWATTSPPVFHNFDVIPTVYRGPYEYSSPAVEEDYLPQEKQLPPGVVEPTGH